MVTSHFCGLAGNGRQGKKEKGLNYFDVIEYVSNSDLGSLRDAESNVEKPDPRKHYAFGSLVDACLTESNSVFWGIAQESIDLGLLDDKDISRAKHLADGMMENPLIGIMVNSFEGQREYYRTMTITHPFETFKIKAKCKFDQIDRRRGISADYKTTTAENQKQFEAAIDFFSWDRQAAWYMDIAEIEQHWIIGVSKKNGKVFFKVIVKWDPMYMRGREKYINLAYLWNMYITNFK